LLYSPHLSHLPEGKGTDPLSIHVTRLTCTLKTLIFQGYLKSTALQGRYYDEK